jgi:hypothetical protein
LPEAVFHRVAAEILAGQPGSTGTAVQESIRQEVAKRLRIDPTIKKAMAEAFAVVLEEFRDATLRDSDVLESVGRQIHGITGGQMLELAQRLREAAVKSVELTSGQIRQWIDEYRKEHDGKYPYRESGLIEGSDGLTWRNVDQALKNGLRDRPERSSLTQFLKEKYDYDNVMRRKGFDIDEILAWADAWRERTGEFPNAQSGPIPEAPGETWAKVDGALRRSGRGLPGGSTLAQLLRERRDKPPPPGNLTLDQIRMWIMQHFERTRKWPARQSGPIADAPGETWNAVYLALNKGRRGLPNGFSLAGIVRELRSRQTS